MSSCDFTFPRRKALRLLPLSESALARFWCKVDKRGPDECWNWTASKNLGYGQFRLFPNGFPMARAHRVSWSIANGEIPPDKEICHKCDNPACVNPNHLFTGSHHENILDAKTKGRMKNNWKLDEQEVVEIKALLATGVSQYKIANQFGVSQGMISLIARNRRWSHIPRNPNL